MITVIANNDNAAFTYDLVLRVQWEDRIRIE